MCTRIIKDKLRRICNEASWNNYLIDLWFSTNILQWLIVSCKFCETVKMHNSYRCHRAWNMSDRIRENNLSMFLQSSSSYLNYLTFEKSNFCWLTFDWVIVSSCLMLRMLLNRYCIHFLCQVISFNIMMPKYLKYFIKSATFFEVRFLPLHNL